MSSYIQGSSIERTVFLAGEGPMVNLPLEALLVEVKKAGGNFETLELVEDENWIELGDGYYTLVLSPEETNVIGTLVYRVTGDDLVTVFDQISILEALPDTAAAADICVISGKLVGLAGNAAPGSIRVSARMVDAPSKTGDTLIAAETAFTFLDYLGAFQLALLRGAVVVIEIPRAGIRHQITVPDSPAADLLDLLPPIHNDYTP